MTRSTRPGRSRRSPAVRVMLPALALAAALAVTACQPVKSGAALIVGGDRVPVSEVQDKVAQVIEQRARTGQQPQPVNAVTEEQVRRIILLHILDRAGQAAGVSVSQADIDNQRRTFEQQAGGAEAFNKQVAESNIVPGDLNDFLRSLILQQKIGDVLVPNVTNDQEQQQRAAKVNELVGKVTRELDIKVNPRYGKWNPESFAIEPAFPAFVRPERDVAAAGANQSQPGQ